MHGSGSNGLVARPGLGRDAFLGKRLDRKNFALIGAGGYVAPRHMEAMKALGADLHVATDPNDSVGVMDSYFPNAEFFTEFGQFDRHVEALRRHDSEIDYVSICSPNYLHDAHCQFALNSGADAICEKPVVLHPSSIDALSDLEARTGRRVFSILQLRLHPEIQALRAKIAASPQREFDVTLTYVASRGRWYHVSWKGQEEKSGGVATNIGIHFFDMLVHLFGPASMNVVHMREADRAGGFLQCARARVRWFLSVDRRDLPAGLAPDKSTYRSITVDDEEFEFSDGFANLHTQSYAEIMKGAGFGLEDTRPSVEIVSKIRTAPIEKRKGERHENLELDAVS